MERRNEKKKGGDHFDKYEYATINHWTYDVLYLLI